MMTLAEIKEEVLPSLTPAEQMELAGALRALHSGNNATPGAQPRARPPEPIHKRHPVSGLLYNAAPGQPHVTLADIKAALEDFP